MFGLRIQELRAAHGWSQANLAKMLNVSIKTVKNWETGISEPSAKSLIRLARLFSVSVDYILNIDTSVVIYLDDLSKQDQICLIGMCQLYINNALSKSR